MREKLSNLMMTVAYAVTIAVFPTTTHWLKRPQLLSRLRLPPCERRGVNPTSRASGPMKPTRPSSVLPGTPTRSFSPRYSAPN
jgi:hypothetical protein